MPAVLTFQAIDRRDETLRFHAVGSLPSLLRHLRRAISDWRREATEREIGDFIEGRGGRITDDLERQIGRRLG